LCVVEEVGPALPFGETEEGPPLIDTPGGNRGTDAVGRFLGEALGPPLILTPRPDSLSMALFEESPSSVLDTWMPSPASRLNLSLLLLFVDARCICIELERFASLSLSVDLCIDTPGGNCGGSGAVLWRDIPGGSLGGFPDIVSEPLELSWSSGSGSVIIFSFLTFTRGVEASEWCWVSILSD